MHTHKWPPDRTQTLIDHLRMDGYGITINLWAEDSDVAVVLWRNGNPVASGRADTSLYFALKDAVAHIPGDE